MAKRTEGADHLSKLVQESRRKPAGAEDHRAFVGPPEQYDFMGATQFRLAAALGLREDHRYLDIGCGSLRAGKYFIQYLLPGGYHGLEPNEWLIETAFELEIGEDARRIKRPVFVHNDRFDYSGLGADFDMICAQSIFSHTGWDTFRTALGGIKPILANNGQFIFTALTEPVQHWARMPKARRSEGWVYPGCVTFRESDLLDQCREAGLVAQRLDWFHPRQIWYRAVHDPSGLLSPIARSVLGSGFPLNDDRFGRGLS